MSKPYDATAKELLAMDPAAWAAYLGVVRPPERVALRDSDLSTVTAAADKVLVIEDDSPWIVDVEFQAWRDPSLPRQLLKYNALLHDRHKVPVASVVVVLTRDADSPAYTGRYGVAPPFGPAWEFGYTVVRVWETSAEVLLTGPLALSPLAPVANVDPAGLDDVLRRTVERVYREAAHEANWLLTAVSILLQMRYGAMSAKELLDRIPGLRDLELFQLYAEEGRAKALVEGRIEGRIEGRNEGQIMGRDEGRFEEARSMIFRQGRKKFGPPTPEQEAALTGITDLPRLEALGERILDVATWDELLKAE